MNWQMVRSFVGRLRSFLLEIIPLRCDFNPLAYAKSRLDDPTQQENIATLHKVAVTEHNENRWKELRDLAKSMKDDEEKRGDSILTRAQGLFVALTLFSVL